MKVEKGGAVVEVFREGPQQLGSRALSNEAIIIAAPEQGPPTPHPRVEGTIYM